jgi:tRNA 2-thiouridine synthesizing protein C
MGAADQRQTLFVISQTPQASAAARERLDQVLMALAFDQLVRVAFVGDGVWQLLSEQGAPGAATGEFTDGYKSLAIYAVAGVYAEREALDERAIDSADLLMPVQVISRQAMARLMHEQELLL